MKGPPLVIPSTRIGGLHDECFTPLLLFRADRLKDGLRDVASKS